MHRPACVTFVLALATASTGLRAAAPYPLADAAALQARLNAASRAGEKVELAPGRYRLDKPITIPEGVTLSGSWEAPHHAQVPRGTVFEVVTGGGDENGPALVDMRPSSTVRGITFYYPDQRVPDAIPYPWTIQGRGMHCSVIDCTFVNAYKAIDFGSFPNELHYIRNCFGCPLKVGIRVDQCTDIGRIENVHFNPHYWARAETPNVPRWPALRRYLWENLVAFEFGRTDWEYVLNTFCFGARIGYRFYENTDGAVKGTVNGNFLGIGADWCHRAVLVEASQEPGLLITNGEFVGGEGAEVMLEVAASHRGVIQLANCAFWGPCPAAVLLDGPGSLSLSQCNFLNHGQRKPGTVTIDARRGDLIVQACRFKIDAPDIRLGERVATAVIMGNWFNGSKDIENASRGDVQEGLNVVARRPATRPASGPS